MERADLGGGLEEVSPASRRVRLIAGIAVLALLGVVGAFLIPPYFENMRFQRYLDGGLTGGRPPDALRAEILNKAAQLGLPVKDEDIHITRKGNGMRVEIVYVIRVDLPLYTVDLHFHPAADI